METKTLDVFCQFLMDVHVAGPPGHDAGKQTRYLFAYPAFPVISTFPIRFPRFPTQAISPHATADPPYRTQASKTRLQSRRDQRPAPQIPRQSGSRIFPRPAYPVSTHPQPTSPHKSRIHTSPTRKSTSAPARPWRASQPAETSGRLTQTYAFYQLTQIPCADEGGMGMASPRDAASTSQWGPAFKPA